MTKQERGKKEGINEGQGYVMIRDQEVQVITGYRKILHSINLTSWTESLEMIENNINKLNHKNEYLALVHNFKSLAEEIKNLIPHSRNRRGLVNILGKGFKYLTGVMDSDDEIEIKQRLDVNEENNHNAIEGLNNQVRINKNFDEAMENVTKHINVQQIQIKNQLSYLVNKINKEVSQIENMQHVFQIQYDIQLLREQVKKVKENLLLSKLGIISNDILSTQEIEKYNVTIKDMMYIKSSVILYDNRIIFVLLLPNYSESKFYRVFIEPVPNKNNLELVLEDKLFLINDKILYENVDNVIEKKNLKPITNKQKTCQLLVDNAPCNFRNNNNTEIKQITNNILITKNIPTTKIRHNCNAFEIVLSKNNLVKFENCELKIYNITYENYVFNDNFVIPNFNNLTIRNIVMNFLLADLHIKNLNNSKIIEEVKQRNNVHESVTLSLIPIIIILVVVFLIFYWKEKCIGTNVQIELKSLNSSEKNFKEGRVTSKLPFKSRNI